MDFSLSICNKISATNVQCVRSFSVIVEFVDNDRAISINFESSCLCGTEVGIVEAGNVSDNCRAVSVVLILGTGANRINRDFGG